MKVMLKSVDPVSPQDQIVVESLPAVFGRDLMAEVRIPCGWVSRRHCILEQCGPELVVRDMGSTHGTMVNGFPVDEKVLQPGDRLTIGISSFEVQFDSCQLDSALLVSEMSGTH